MLRSVRLLSIASLIAVAASATAMVVRSFDVVASVTTGVLLLARSWFDDALSFVSAKIAPACARFLIEPAQRLTASKANARSIEKRAMRIESGWRMCTSV